MSRGSCWSTENHYIDFQAADQAKEQAHPAIHQAKVFAKDAQAKLQGVVDDATGGASGGSAAHGELDQGQMLDSKKLAAVSELLANTLGSGRL